MKLNLPLIIAVFLAVSSARLTVHLLPHSHCDPGYRETFEEYYHTEVRSILTTVVESLQNDTKKRFIWEEVSFLSLWWKEQDQETKDTVKSLAAQGRLEFTGGGWVMHDEAVTSYPAIVNQMTYGLDFLERELNYRPRIGWHIDPFGSSIFTPTLYALLGYDGMVINRIPDQTKQYFKMTKHLEFFWESHSLLPANETTIFTHVLDSHYQTPTIIGLTPKEKASSLAATCQERSNWFKTEHLLVPFGSDFEFTHAQSKFQRMDPVLDYINANQELFNMTIQYSTLSEYFNAVQSSGVSFPTYSGRDFFPYIACSPCGSPQCGGLLSSIPCGSDGCFWSGFYTSKPQQKLLSRQQDASLRALEATFSLSSVMPDVEDFNSVLETVDLGRSTSALLQHHDALPGTSFAGCYSDYNKRLNMAMSQAEEVQGNLLSLQLCRTDGSFHPHLSTDSADVFTSNNTLFAMVVYNSLGWKRSEVVRIANIPDGICLKTVEGPYVSQQIDSVLYVDVAVGPLSAVTIFLEKSHCSDSRANFLKASSLRNDLIELDFNPDGQLVKFRDLVRNVSISLVHSFWRYHEHENLIATGFSRSSVYTFMPDEPPQEYRSNSSSTVVTAQGPLVWEITQHFTPYIVHSFRIVANSSAIHMQTKIGPLPTEPRASYFSRIQSSIDSGIFSTTVDNEYQEMAREYNSSATVQGNTYPLTGRASINDTKTVMSWLVSRPVAVTAVNGSMSVMLHRRLESLIDPRGNDDSVMNDVSYLRIEDASKPDCVYCESMKTQYPLLHFFSPLTAVNEWNTTCKESWEAVSVTAALPQSLHLVSLQIRSLSKNERLVGLRLHHNSFTSAEVSFNLLDIFPNFEIKTANETSIDFNKFYSEVTCLSGTHAIGNSCVVTLRPMTLKAYLLSLSEPLL